MAGSKWMPSEVLVLEQYYEEKSKQELLCLLPTRSWEAIKLKANQLGLSFYDKNYNFSAASSLARLLEESPEAYYWIGFLAADGSFTHNRLAFELAKRDSHHIDKFCEFIGCGTQKSIKANYGVRVQDRNLVPAICKKFHLRPAKTYYPPMTNGWIKDDNLFLAYFIGYIDGDGSICHQSGGRKDCFLRIKCHQCWLPFLQDLSNRYFSILEDTPRIAKLTPQGDTHYAQLTIASQHALKYLKMKCLSLKLPVLARKWDKIHWRQRYAH